jgi:hypothetical protein
MKQLALQGVTPFAPSPVNAPDEVVTACPSEAAAIRWSLDFAKECHGMSLRTVARLCGWKHPSFLCELASDSSGKRMPEERTRVFVLATGIRLVEQYQERQITLRQLSGKPTASDRSRMAVAAMLAQYQREAA